MYVSFNIVVKYGSTYVVCRQKKTPTYKDLDFVELHPEGILLEADTHQALIKTIERDCRVSEMDSTPILLRNRPSFALILGCPFSGSE